MFLYGAMQSRNLNVQIIRVNATVLHWRSWHKKLQLTRAEVDSLTKYTIGSLVLPDVQSEMCSKETNINKALKVLEKDLINGPFHSFGHHSRSSADFCSTTEDRLQ